MATEQGIVTKTNAHTAWVRTTKTSACESCAVRGSCTVLGGGKEMEVEAINHAGAKVGEKVVISFASSPLLKATFMLYVLPILFLLVGALIGDKLAPSLAWDRSTFALLTGLLFFVLAITFVKAKGNKLAKTDEYRPKITKIISSS